METQAQQVPLTERTAIRSIFILSFTKKTHRGRTESKKGHTRKKKGKKRIKTSHFLKLIPPRDPQHGMVSLHPFLAQSHRATEPQSPPPQHSPPRSSRSGHSPCYPCATQYRIEGTEGSGPAISHAAALACLLGRLQVRLIRRVGFLQLVNLGTESRQTSRN